MSFFSYFGGQRAGGASGFLPGSIFAFSLSVAYGALGGISMLECLANAMFKGYIAEAVNKNLYSLRMLLITGLTAGIIGSLALFLF